METKLSLKNFTTNQHEPTRTITRIRSKSFWCSLLIILFVNLTASNFLFSQDVNANYFIETQNGEQRIRQRLTWRGGANTYRYEVVIEKNENESFVPYVREFSSTTFIIVSMIHGNYRFCVIPYDIFDIAGQPSEWRNLEVRQALKPQLSEAQPEIMTDTNGDPYGFVVYVSGNNLHPDAEFFLRHPNNTRTILDDVEYGEEGDVRIYVDSANLEPGEYNIIVKNPGGFEAEIHRTVINDIIEQIAKSKEQKKPGDMLIAERETESDIFLEPQIGIAFENTDEEDTVSSDEVIKTERKLITKLNIGWSPIISIYGINLLSMDSIFANFTLTGKLPVDLYMGAEIGTRITVTGVSNLIINFNLLLQKYIFKEIISLNFKAGAGMLIFTNLSDESYMYNSEYYSDKFLLNIGLSFSWRIIKFLLLDAGVNYVHLFGDIKTGSISPWIGIGFQF